MEEIITNATENVAEVAAEQVVKTGGLKIFKKCGIIILGAGALYGVYRGAKYLCEKHAEKKAAAGQTVVASEKDFDNVAVAKRDFLEDTDNEE